MEPWSEKILFSTLQQTDSENEPICPAILSQRQILGTGNLLQNCPVCINIDISPEMAAQSAQRNQAFCVTASDWFPIPCQPT